MKELLVATTNLHKFGEIKGILDGIPFELLCLEDVNYNKEIIENGESFEENAVIKAKQVGRDTGYLTVADDSGLVVDALDGKPGVYSARFGGEDNDYTHKMSLILDELKDVEGPKRTARFVCVAVLYSPHTNTCKIVKGVVNGRIATEIRGTNGFGYDPIFIPEGYNRTFGELDPEIKASISHRYKAFSQIKGLLLKGGYVNGNTSSFG